MSFNSPEELLQKTGWPTQFLDRRGVLSWSKVLAEDIQNPLNTSVASAAVLVNNELITLRYRTATLGGKVTPEFEAKWQIGPDSKPTLLSCVEMGQAVSLDSNAALVAFQNRLLLMAVVPSFEPMAVRQPARPKASPPRLGA